MFEKLEAFLSELCLVVLIEVRVFKNELDVEKLRHPRSDKLSETSEKWLPQHVLFDALALMEDPIRVNLRLVPHQLCDSAGHALLNHCLCYRTDRGRLLLELAEAIERWSVF